MTDPVATGARLKAERERRGLSVQKAADELHLDGWVIEALEADDFERIGPSVYAKGHLKRYAALLGLPAEEIMAGYESRVQNPKPAAAPPTANVRLRADAPAVSNIPWPRIVGAAAVLLLVLAVLWWKPWHRHGTAAANGADGAASRGEAAANGGEAVAKPRAAGGGAADAVVAVGAAASPSMMQTSLAASPGAAQPVAGAAPAQQPATTETDATLGVGRARLRLSFSADSWVDVHDAAGRRVFAGNGRANSVKTIAGIAPMRVYLGFASGVQLEVNDRAVAIGPQFLAGDVARFEAGADGVLRRDSRSAAAPAGANPHSARPSA
jgi:cytoskeleton protein RodZ